MRLSAFLMAAVLAVSLSGCKSFVTSPAVQQVAVSTSTTSVSQASTVKAAGDMYVTAVRLATLYVENGKPGADVLDKMEKIESQLYAALMDARRADKDGNSPALAAGLSLFNANFADLAKMVPGLR